MKRFPFIRAFVLALAFVVAPSAPPWSFSQYVVTAQEKTVKVREYKRKDGTVVKAHERRAPRKRETTEPTTERKDRTVARLGWPQVLSGARWDSVSCTCCSVGRSFPRSSRSSSCS